MLKNAAPFLADEVSKLDNTPKNHEILLKVHQHYLSPSGVLLEKIKQHMPLARPNHVEPWFQNDSLASFTFNLPAPDPFPIYNLFEKSGISAVFSSSEKKVARDVALYHALYNMSSTRMR